MCRSRGLRRPSGSCSASRRGPTCRCGRSRCRTGRRRRSATFTRRIQPAPVFARRTMGGLREHGTGQKTTIYVQPFPATGSQVSALRQRVRPPAHEVVWSPDGKELFYDPGLGGFEAVSVTTQPTFAFGNAVAVPRPFQLAPRNSRTLYDITPGGKFVGLIPPGQTEFGHAAVALRKSRSSSTGSKNSERACLRRNSGVCPRIISSERWITRR